MVAVVSEAVMSDGSPFPFAPLLNVEVEDGRVFNDLTASQVFSLALREGWDVRPAQS